MEAPTRTLLAKNEVAHIVIYLVYSYLRREEEGASLKIASMYALRDFFFFVWTLIRRVPYARVLYRIKARRDVLLGKKIYVSHRERDASFFLNVVSDVCFQSPGFIETDVAFEAAPNKQ